MKDFSKFAASFVNQNKMLWATLGASLLISSLTLFFVLSSQRYFIVSNGKIFKERLLTEDICLESFSSMASGSPNTYLISDGIMQILEHEPFELKVDQVLKVSSIEAGKCRLIIKSSGVLRSFVVGLIEDKSFPFSFKLNQLDEVELKENI